MRPLFAFLAAAGCCLTAPAVAQTTFGTPVTTTYTADAVRALTYDLNNDFVPDVVIAGGGGRMAVVLLGTAGGTFAAPQYFPTVGFCGGVALGNSNCDTYPDLYVSDGGIGGVRVYPGLAGGQFGAGAVVASGGSPQHVVAGDVNRDGKTDFATVDKLTGTLSVRLTTGVCAPTYGAAADYATASGGLSADLARMVDLNGDGLLDVLVLNQASPTNRGLSVLLGTAAGAFGPATTYPTGTGIPVDVTVQDVNGDARPDAVVAFSNSPNLGVFLGGTAPQLGARVDYALPAGALAVAVGRVDADVHDDLMAVLTTGDVVLLRGLGAGAFAPAVTVASLPQVGAYAQLLLADFNGDFRNDVVVASSGRVRVLLNATALGTARGTFAAGGVYPNPAAGGVFHLGDEGATNVHVTNMQGQAVRSIRNGDAVTLPGVAAGVYVVDWYGGDGQRRYAKVALL